METSKEFVVGKHKIGYLSSSFAERYGTEIFDASERVLKSDKLTRYMTDDEIEKEFGAQKCTLGDVIHFLDTAGKDCKDGNWNIFYVSAFVVHVYWYGDAWGVGTWERDDNAWDADVRVFSPATDALKLVPDPVTLKSLNFRIEKLEALINPKLLV